MRCSSVIGLPFTAKCCHALLMASAGVTVGCVMYLCLK